MKWGLDSVIVPAHESDFEDNVRVRGQCKGQGEDDDGGDDDEMRRGVRIRERPPGSLHCDVLHTLMVPAH